MSTVAKLLSPAIDSAERGRIPDPLIEPGEVDHLVEEMRGSDVALVPDLANEQHYEVPPDFFRIVLGAHLKYSCCHWSAGTRTLDEAETEALEITARRAGPVGGVMG